MAQRIIYRATWDEDSIAIHVSNKALLQLGWSFAPDLLLSKLIEETLRPTDPECSRRYSCEYASFGENASSNLYETEVRLTIKDSKCISGTIMVRHCKTNAEFSFGFIVDWSPEYPVVTLSLPNVVEF